MPSIRQTLTDLKDKLKPEKPTKTPKESADKVYGKIVAATAHERIQKAKEEWALERSTTEYRQANCDRMQADMQKHYGKEPA